MMEAVWLKEVVVRFAREELVRLLRLEKSCGEAFVRFIPKKPCGVQYIRMRVRFWVHKLREKTAERKEQLLY